MKRVTDFRPVAEKKWRDAEWIAGNGQYALISQCNVLTITLWADLAIAKACKELIDKTTCGAMCCGTLGHEIVDLEKAR